MASTEQINANQTNSQLSTGPTTQEGKVRSSQNAVRHGFTGLKLIVTPDEKEAYEAFVADYLDQYNPTDPQQRQLVHQLSDLDWSVHQISLQQHNTISLMNAAAAHQNENFDPAAAATLLLQFSRLLTNLNTYEVRRRRAGTEVRAQLDALKAAYAKQYAEEMQQCVQIFKLHKLKGETWNPMEFGFVCSIDDVERFIEGQELANEVRKLR
jgi:hypothetical protein